MNSRLKAALKKVTKEWDDFLQRSYVSSEKSEDKSLNESVGIAIPDL